MVAFRVVVCLAVLAAAAVATNVQQCPGKSFENLSETVEVTPCKKPPCRLKKGSNPAIKIHFTTSEELEVLKNRVTAEVLGVDFPFLGVDGASVCDKIYTEDGEKVSCPLKAGTRYIYTDNFPVLAFYPSILTKVHWALQNKDGEDLVCFEVPVRIA